MGQKNRNLKKKVSYALGTLKSHFVPKNQILAIYGSAQHLVRLKWPNRIIEEDWKIQKIALNWFGWFFGPNFWHRYSMGWHYSEKKFRGDSGQNWPHPVTFSDVGEIPTFEKSLHWPKMGQNFEI